jgi:hypothetical protein
VRLRPEACRLECAQRDFLLAVAIDIAHAQTPRAHAILHAAPQHALAALDLKRASAPRINFDALESAIAVRIKYLRGGKGRRWAEVEIPEREARAAP